MKSIIIRIVVQSDKVAVLVNGVEWAVGIIIDETPQH